MATKGKVDNYANIASVAVVESAINTQTSVKFNFPFSIMDKMALIISRMEYWFEGIDGLNGSTDRVVAALTASATVVAITNQADPLIIDSTRMLRIDTGAAATGHLITQPFIKDFSSLPGNGLIVAPSPLYGMVQGTGVATVVGCTFKLFYSYIELNTDEYWQLVESRRIISNN
jgi:hypothetical protein